MSGMFDLHATIALRHGWQNTWAASSAQFKKPFVGIADSVLDDWYAELVPSGNTKFIKFGTAFTPDVQPHPFISVSMDEEPMEAQPLNYYGGLDASSGSVLKVRTVLLRQVLTINIYAPGTELTRALHVIARAIMMDNNAWFSSVGYNGLNYLGGSDLMQEENVFFDQLGVFTRTQRWSVFSEAKFTEATGASKSSFVYSSDETVNSNTGGVTPQ